MELVPEPIQSALTERAHSALLTACAIADHAGASAIEPQHILLALTRSRGSLARLILTHHRLAGTHPPPAARPNRALALSDAARTLLTHAAAVAAKYRHRHVGTEHLLFGATALDHAHYPAPSFKASVLTNIRDHLEDVFASLNRFPALANLAEVASSLNAFAATVDRNPKPREAHRPAGAHTAGKRAADANSALAYFGDDLIDRAANGTLDAVIGRGAETDRLIRILCRRTKNNPVLIGEPGVGKTAIVQGLAQRMAAGNVPDVLRNRPLVMLDLGLLVAGTVFRGEFEHRLKNVLREAASARAILFIDELHTVVGAGSAQGSLDAANILKPALTRGELQCIGATTLDEYRRYVEKDAALERRFQSVFVAEATAADTRAILEAIRPEYETHHRIAIHPDAIAETVRLAERYLTDRRFPDKALDVLDEAAARLRLTAVAPDEAGERTRLRSTFERLNREKEAAVLAGQYETATALRRDSARVERMLANLGRTDTPRASGGATLELRAPHIRSSVAEMTGIPIEDIECDEGERLLLLESRLTERIVGQPEATRAVASSLRRARAGLNPARRPWGSFLFLGPSGVGKTELARALAEMLFGRPDALIKLDMSEYAEAHAVARLIGAPPGYIGYDDAGTLAERIRRTPFSVVLFDEIEKAHPQAQHLLLQILEDGALTDGQGRRINFANTIIIMTSNVGTEAFARAAHLGFTPGNQSATLAFDRIRDRALGELKQLLRPELLNRIDHTIVFRPLDRHAIAAIIRLQLDALGHRLAERNTSLITSRGVTAFLAAKAWQPLEGARLVRRVIEEHVESPLATVLISPGRPRTRIRLAVVNGRIAIR